MYIPSDIKVRLEQQACYDIYNTEYRMSSLRTCETAMIYYIAYDTSIMHNDEVILRSVGAESCSTTNIYTLWQ